MRAFLALLCLAFFIFGFYLMGTAFNYPDKEGYIFGAGLIVCFLAVGIPMSQRDR